MPCFTRRLAAVALLCLCGPWAAAAASQLRFCDQPPELSVAEQDRILRVSAIVKQQLEQSGHRLALVSRSGLDLRRFGVRYTHSGVSLRASRELPWAVRQLYYACDEKQPRIFDQGMSGFLLGLENPSVGYVSAVLLPADAEAAVERAVLDDRQALQLLGARYSANAHAFSVMFQNCNQWLAEMLAVAWSPPDVQGDSPREKAQAWLRREGYRPAEFLIHLPPPTWLGGLFPLLHHEDHPREDLERSLMRVSMPASIEAFVRQRVPDARRLEFCFTTSHVVMRRGWEPLADGCRPAAGDTVVSLGSR